MVQRIPNRLELATDANGNVTGLVGSDGKTHATLGTNFITVGAGGMYTSIDDAMTYLCALGGTDVWSETVGAGTVAVTQHSDVVTGTGTAFLTDIEPGDYVSIAGDGGVLTAAGPLCHALWGVHSNTSLRLGTGFLGASGSGKAYSIWRPVKYHVLLLPGVHELTGTFALPQGMHLTIRGFGVGVTRLEHVGASTIAFQRSNYIDFGLMSTYMRDSSADIFGYIGGLGVTDCGLGKFNIHDIDTDYAGQESTSVGPAVMHLRGSMIRVANITGRCASAFAVTMSDYIEYENVHFEAYNAGADCIQSAAYGAFSSTKPWIYNNVGVDRKLAGITGAGAICEFNGPSFIDTSFANTKKVYVNDAYFIDHDQQGATAPSCMQIAANMGNSEIYLSNVIIDGVRGLNLIAGATVSVYAKDVRDLNNQPPHFISTTTPYYSDTPGAQDVAYAGTITPKAGLGRTIRVGTLTGNTTIAAPLYPLKGQRLTFVFTQDGTGGRTITWNAVFKKAADGAGTANKKGATTFEYDGTNWMQVSGALTFA